MLGIEDTAVTVAIILSILSALTGVTYGIMHWNADIHTEGQDLTLEEQWEKEEKKDIDSLLE